MARSTNRMLGVAEEANRAEAVFTRLRELPKFSRPFPRRLVAFLDILGWTEATKVGSNSEQLLALFYMKFSEAPFLRGSLPVGDTRATNFSDCIVYSSDDTPNGAAGLVVRVQATCMSLLAMGYYVRGGISIGELAHTEGILAGRGLIEAYTIERDVAKYPRIVVSDDAAPFLRLPPMKDEPPPGPSQIRVDFDGLFSLEILPVESQGTRLKVVQDVANQAKKQVMENIQRTRNPNDYPDQAMALGRRSKHVWMLNYLENVIQAPSEPPR